MKKYTIILITLIVLIAQSCDTNNNKITTDIVKNTKSAVNASADGTAPKMYFEETVHDFGDMIQGERVVYGFKFINTGGSDLVITKVGTSCGCTVGSYPKDPIKSKGSGIIEVAFDSKGKRGFQNKSITILANTEPNTTTLRVKGKVIMPEKN